MHVCIVISKLHCVQTKTRPAMFPKVSVLKTLEQCGHQRKCCKSDVLELKQINIDVT